MSEVSYEQSIIEVLRDEFGYEHLYGPDVIRASDRYDDALLPGAVENVAIAAADVATNQGLKSIVPKKEFGTAFVYCFLVRNKKKIADMGAGTTFPEVSGSTMKSTPLSLPNEQLRAEFSAFSHPILEQQKSLELENRRLCLLRDALLPKLMSGEIDVSKVDLTQLNSHLADC